MSHDYPVRAIGDEEFPAFHSVADLAFNPAPERGIADELTTFEFPRSLAAFDGATMVGTACSYSFELTLPGAAAPAAGVSRVSVLPSHRRRGILTALMRRQIDDVRARGEALAVLFASDTGIYGRFGYGAASLQARFSLRRGEGVLAAHAPVDSSLTLRAEDPDRARPDLARVYDAVRPARPGFHDRGGRWWDAALREPEDPLTAGRLRCVVAADAGGPRGYALFLVKGGWGEDGLPAGEIAVRELMAADPAAGAALWSDLLSRDLVATVTAGLRPADDPLLHLLADRRRARARIGDGLWARLVDVGAALALRRYACPADVVIEVSDGFCPWNQGRWRLTAAAGAGPPAAGAAPSAAGLAAACEPTSAPADVAMPASALAAAYLGGVRLGSLAAAGLVAERRPGALASLSAALAWDPAPWCPRIF